MREGEIARLSCLIDSIPFPPNITWQHNGEPISLDRNSTKYEISIAVFLMFTVTRKIARKYLKKKMLHALCYRYYFVSPGVLYISATTLSDAGSYR